MRLHRLEMTAFGPFGHTATIDFDAVSEAGLFLIHGPTGSGKSSILDAVCFALYAGVPGARAGTRSGLGSDHAPAGTVPRVALDFSAGGRRFRVTRTPQYLRPRRNGSGLRSMHATVSLEERRDGRWAPLATRPQDVGLQLNDVIGLGLDQFAKVVLLPQGEFAAFLRAAPDARRDLLERLFDTSRMTDIEAWLADRKRTSLDAVAATRGALDRHLLQINEALASLPSEPPTAGPPTGPAPSGQPSEPAQDAERAGLLVAPPDADLGGLADSVSTVVASVDARAAESVLVEDELSSRATRAEADLRAAVRLREHQGVASRASAALAAIEDSTPIVEDARHRIEWARRADLLDGHLVGVRRATTTMQAARRAVLGAREAAGSAGLPLDQVAGLDAAPVSAPVPAPGGSTRPEPVAAPQALLIRLRAQQPALTRATELESSVAGLRHDRQVALALIAAQAEVRRAATSERDGLTALLEAAGIERDLAAELAARRAARDSALTRLDHAGRQAADLAVAERQTAHLAVMRAEHAALATDLESRVFSLRTDRLRGIAGELAADLRDGSPCQVCGSRTHPEPAHSTSQVTDEAIQDAENLADHARADLQDGVAAHAAAQERSAAAGARLVELLDGVPRADLTHARDAAAAALAESDTAQERASELEAQLAAATSRLAGVGAELANADLRDAEAHTTAKDAERRLRTQLHLLEELTAEHESSCPCRAAGPEREQILATHLHCTAAAERLVHADRRFADASEAFDRARCDLAQALRDNGFDSIDAAVGARLDAAERTELSGLVEDTDLRARVARDQLADPDITAAAEVDPPDIDRLQDDLDAVTARAREAHHTRRALQGAADRLHAHHRALAEALQQLAPAQADAAVVARMADLVNGNGSDNRLRMRLSSYLLAARLEQVARLANQRLDTMSGGRFSLEYTDALAARGARSGLGLVVQDAWTGKPRETSTLSGGEAFMASLALALGLGDAVRMEAGGLELGTLFVDEGFGSLDEESLEQVMSVLDGLRDGGRTVGIVSHVADLRQRIPAQIELTKTPHGSTLRLRSSQSTQPAA